MVTKKSGYIEFYAYIINFIYFNFVVCKEWKIYSKGFFEKKKIKKITDTVKTNPLNKVSIMRVRIWTNLCGFDSFRVRQPDSLPEVGQQVSGQRAPGGSRPDAVSDVALFEGDELRVGNVMDGEGRPLLCGF